MPYSIDLRRRVVEAIKSGMSKSKASRTYQVCKQTVYNWLELENKTGDLVPTMNYQKGHSHGIKDLDAFKNYVDEHPSHTQEELASHFGVGSSTIGRNLQKIGYTRKKRVRPIQKEVKVNAKSI